MSAGYEIQKRINVGIHGEDGVKMVKTNTFRLDFENR
jgi:hypothetical protein